MAEHLAVNHSNEALAAFLRIQLWQGHLGLEVLCLCTDNAVLLLLVEEEGLGTEGQERERVGWRGRGRGGEGCVGSWSMKKGVTANHRNWKHKVTFPEKGTHIIGRVHAGK